MNLPQRITIKEVLSSRYAPELLTDYSGLDRPADWDQRVSGKDVILSSDDQQIVLKSGGGQSTPKQGWVLLLTSGSQEDGYDWTLYGIPKKSAKK